MAEAPAGGILDRSTAFFEATLWESDEGASARERMQRHGLEAAALRDFRVGYAPGRAALLRDHLREAGHEDEELVAAGLASPSEREYAHVLFHARIIFPIAGPDGRVSGFAGLATHLGPSWPLWVTSPDGHRFRIGRAIFGCGEAAAEIRERQRGLVLRASVQVIALHQSGRHDAVAVIQSPITRAHLARLAHALGVDRRDLHLARRDGRLGVLAVPRGTEVVAQAFADRSTPAGFSLIDSPRPTTKRVVVEDQEVDDEAPPARAIVYVAGILIGAGIPLGALALADTSIETETGPAPAFSIVVVSIAAAYLVLAVAVARFSARVRAQSTERRMRLPWARGRDEVQPAGWTYHRLEEILVGAALVSAVVCMVLLMTVGNFLG